MMKAIDEIRKLMEGVRDHVRGDPVIDEYYQGMINGLDEAIETLKKYE